jgi:hypothetical protein
MIEKMRIDLATEVECRQTRRASMKTILLAALMALAGCAQVTPTTGTREVAQARGREFGYYFTRNVARMSNTGNISFDRLFRNADEIERSTAPFIKGALVEISKRNQRARGAVEFFYNNSRIETLQVFAPSAVQHVYVALNIPTRDIGAISLRFDAVDFTVNSVTLLLNDEQVSDWGGYEDTQYAVMYHNAVSNKYYFGKAYTDIDAEFQARSACQAQSYSSNCRLFKREMITDGHRQLSCKIKNAVSNKFFLGTASSVFEAEFIARDMCSKESYASNCNSQSLECDSPANLSDRQVCMVRNAVSNRSYLGRGATGVLASFEAQRQCAAQSYASNCANPSCESVDILRRRPFVCVVDNRVSNRSHRGEGETRLEAEFQARSACEAQSYASNCAVTRCE